MVEQSKVVWGVETYESDSLVVPLKGKGNDVTDMPYLLVSLEGLKPHDKTIFYMCVDLANYLNGHKRPKWLNDMYRKSRSELIGCDNSSVLAVGPLWLSDVDKLLWKEREDKEAVMARARLIDRLCNIK